VRARKAIRLAWLGVLVATRWRPAARPGRDAVVDVTAETEAARITRRWAERSARERGLPVAGRAETVLRQPEERPAAAAFNERVRSVVESDELRPANAGGYDPRP